MGWKRDHSHVGCPQAQAALNSALPQFQLSPLPNGWPNLSHSMISKASVSHSTHLHADRSGRVFISESLQGTWGKGNAPSRREHEEVWGAKEAIQSHSLAHNRRRSGPVATRASCWRIQQRGRGTVCNLTVVVEGSLMVPSGHANCEERFNCSGPFRSILRRRMTVTDTWFARTLTYRCGWWKRFSVALEKARIQISCSPQRGTCVANTPKNGAHWFLRFTLKRQC